MRPWTVHDEARPGFDRTNDVRAEVALELPVRLVAPPVDIPKYDLKMYWHQRFHQNPKINWLRSVVVELFADGGPAAALGA